MNVRSVKKNFMETFSTSAMSHNDVALRILQAADTVMAEQGVQHLSTHKIAKAAKVSVGTIYLYFKDKNDLLTQLVLHLFECYHRYTQQAFDPSLSLFEQYRALWHSTWQYMQDNPNVVQNFYQYESLPMYREMVQSCIDNHHLAWNRFVSRGVAEQVIVDLERPILFSLSMHVAWDIMRQQILMKEHYSEEVIEQIILRTWKAITF